MSGFDIAAGATLSGLRDLLARLYAVPELRAGLFAGSQSVDLGPMGMATGGWDVTEVPVLSLTPPSPADWATAHGADPDALPPRPETNAFALTCPAVSVSLTASGVTRTAKGKVVAYGRFTMTKGAPGLEVLAVGLDESGFSMLDALMVNRLIVPRLLDMTRGIAAAIPLPRLPRLAGIGFQPPVFAVDPGGLAIATSREGAPPPDAAGIAPPGPALFALVDLAALNAVIAAALAPSYSADETGGSDAFTASARVTARDLTLTLAAEGAALVLRVTGRFAAYGELSGTGVGITKAVLCPIGAAADAIADPGKWDKVVAEMDLGHSPDPLPVAVAATVAAPAGEPPAQVVDLSLPGQSLPPDLSLSFTPKWSGSVTGSALSAAASAFAGVVARAFEETVRGIAADLLDQEARLSVSLPVAEMTTRVSLGGGLRITLTLGAPPGPVLAPISSSLLCQPLTLTLS
ncbi:hypothetical protein [Salipiger sp.]|uniref:hypothetical protein n=1 Tax=Salipiger sp. TaxID=2078585 RepID=UPI003A9737A7